MEYVCIGEEVPRFALEDAELVGVRMLLCMGRSFFPLDVGFAQFKGWFQGVCRVGGR